MASIRQRGDTWQVRVSKKGFPPESRTFTSKAEARRWATETEAAMLRGKHNTNAGTNATTFREMLERYAQEVSPRKRGHKEEVIRIRALQRCKIAGFSLLNLTAEAIGQFRDDRLQHVQAGAVIRDLSLISSVINHARREWDLTVENPCRLVRKPPTPNGRSRVLSAIEELRLLKALEPCGRRSPWPLVATQLALETAMRRGEMLALRWENVNLDARTALLPVTKNGQARTVPLSSQAVAILGGLPGPRQGSVINISPATLHQAFYRAVRRADLHDLKFHDLRHTAATRMATKLPNVIELAAVTGHQTVQMLRRYYHPDATALAHKLG